MSTYLVPGVYREEVGAAPPGADTTGVPAFLGYTTRGPLGEARLVSTLSDFDAVFGGQRPGGHLAESVRGYFANSRRHCYVIRLAEPEDATALDSLAALQAGLDILTAVDAVDLVAAPDVMRTRGGLTPDPEEVARLQSELLRHCEAVVDRFAVLDALPGATVAEVRAQRDRLESADGALYTPWVRTPAGAVPPCGHVAGVYARTDDSIGVHKAPANEVLEGVVDLEALLGDDDLAELGAAGINGLRARPGTGVRVWGARTLSHDPAWSQVTTRRLVRTVARRLHADAAAVVYEPNDPRLWLRIGREVRSYLEDLFREGALAGRTEEEAFYVRCDEETNTADGRAGGMVVTEVGIAPTLPCEYLTVHLVLDSGAAAVVMPSSA